MNRLSYAVIKLDFGTNRQISVTFKDFLQTRVEKKCCSEKLKSEILEKIRDIDEAGE